MLEMPFQDMRILLHPRAESQQVWKRRTRMTLIWDRLAGRLTPKSLRPGSMTP